LTLENDGPYTGEACENDHKLSADAAMTPRRISDSALRRLSHYLRFLEEFEAQGRDTVSSEELADRGGTTSAQVRKDLSHFGSFGKRGLGYPVPDLRARLARILGVGRRWGVALVGAGKLGAALYAYDGFRRRGFHVVAVFDDDPRKIGRRWGQLEVEDVARLGATVHEKGIEIGIVVTPADAAQEVAQAMVAVGITAILNFAPRKLVLPEGVTLRDVNLEIELEALCFALTHEGWEVGR
jgi:redox-sensing transcriptional repressor